MVTCMQTQAGAMKSPAPEPTNGCNAAQTPHIVLITVPFPGHIIPFCRVAQLLAASGAKLTCFTTGHVIETLQHEVGSTDRHGIANGPNPIRFEALLEEHEVTGETMIMQWMQKGSDEEMKELLERAMRRLAPAPCCIVSDLLLGWVQDVADKLAIPKHIFYTTSATALAFMLMVPDFIEQGKLPMLNNNEDFIPVSGMAPFQYEDMSDSLKTKEHERFDVMVKVCQGLRKSASIMVNTFEELEGDTLRALRTGIIANSKGPDVISIGPLLSELFRGCNENHLATQNQRETASEAEKWLDTQVTQSVLYISFGSLATITKEQIRELALGLEASCRPFLWVFRPPGLSQVTNTSDSMAPHGHEFFPPGFEDRIKGRGMLIKGWAPQPQILAHQATGAFLTHCGWNSCLESICTGVPLLTFPLKADQKQNARYLVEVAQVGLRFNRNVDSLAEHAEIAKVVVQMMAGEEGKAARIRVRELQLMARNAMADSGPSMLLLETFVQKCSPSLCRSRETRMPLELDGTLPSGR